MRIRIATWNLDRPSRNPKSILRREERQRRLLTEIERQHADIWVLTETHESVAPTGLEFSVATSRDRTYHDAGEHCVTIWSRWPLRPVPASDPILTVAAEVILPDDNIKAVIYGTIITYAHDGVSEGAKMWQRHRAAVQTQTADWLNLKTRSGRPLIVAGDFNMNLDGRRWYGVSDAKKALRDGLDAANLTCVTAMDMVAGGLLQTRRNVDHVCLSRAIADGAKVTVWEDRSLSDHNGVMVELQLDAPKHF